MTDVHAGIPRLQELSYLEVAVAAVAAGEPFEGIRRRLVAHMQQLRDETQSTGNTAMHRLLDSDPNRYVRNASETLRELMRLGAVAKKGLPSTASAAAAYRQSKFQLATWGETWANQLTTDRRTAYDDLLERLLSLHPQLSAYLGVLQSRPLVIPLVQWTEVAEPRSRERFINALADHATATSSREDLGWEVSRQELVDAVEAYTVRIEGSAIQRGRPSPFVRNQDFVNTCEEAVVKLAWLKTGVGIDYISQEILRRWTGFLSVANFSYHVPGPNALRYWSTADVSDADGKVRIARRVGASHRRAAIATLSRAYEAARRDDVSRSVWVPIYRVRAAVCWELRLREQEFDAAIEGLLRGEYVEDDIPFGVNVDPAMYGNVPPSERPLRLSTERGERVYYSMSLVPKR
jgi:hypothetical protein